MAQMKSQIQINMTDRKKIQKMQSELSLKKGRDVPVHEIVHILVKEHENGKD